MTTTVQVDVEAEDFWTMLRDWPAVLEWVLPEESPPPPVSVALKEGHSADQLPCTRVLEFEPSLPFPYEETLLYAFPEARRIYYTFNGIPGGLCNYMATTFVEETSPGVATVTCASTWDLPVSESIEDMSDYLAAVYEHMIIRGIEAAVRQRAATAG